MTGWEANPNNNNIQITCSRYIIVGAGHRPLCTEDPSKDTILPADDGAWDSGVSFFFMSCGIDLSELTLILQEIVPPERVCLSSLTSSVSPFARLAQASNLLGRVIRHCNDTALDLEFVLDNYEMLCQTIFSLVELLSQDDSTASIETSIAATICFRYAKLPSYIAHY